ncbi:MAG: hypothetical protein ACOVO0_01215, partial [Burkholderiaceae bacterium]
MNRLFNTFKLVRVSPALLEHLRTGDIPCLRSFDASRFGLSARLGGLRHHAQREQSCGCHHQARDQALHFSNASSPPH